MIMKNTKLIAVPALMGALFIAAAGNQAHATPSNTTDITMTVDNFTSVSSTASISMSPTLSDLQADAVESSGAVELNVVTNNSIGCKVTVAADAAGGGKIAPEDISLRVAVGGEGSGAAVGSFAAYTPLSTTSADLWNTAGAALDGTDVSLDVKFTNLSAYPAVGGVSTNYTNTLTFTAVANS